jgi:hypothetical protein
MQIPLTAIHKRSTFLLHHETDVTRIGRFRDDTAKGPLFGEDTPVADDLMPLDEFSKAHLLSQEVLTLFWVRGSLEAVHVPAVPAVSEHPGPSTTEEPDSADQNEEPQLPIDVQPTRHFAVVVSKKTTPLNIEEQFLQFTKDLMYNHMRSPDGSEERFVFMMQEMKRVAATFSPFENKDAGQEIGFRPPVVPYTGNARKKGAMDAFSHLDNRAKPKKQRARTGEKNGNRSV